MKKCGAVKCVCLLENPSGGQTRSWRSQPEIAGYITEYVECADNHFIGDDTSWYQCAITLVKTSAFLFSTTLSLLNPCGWKCTVTLAKQIWKHFSDKIPTLSLFKQLNPDQGVAFYKSWMTNDQKLVFLYKTISQFDMESHNCLS